MMTRSEILAALADGEPHTFPPHPRTVRLLLSLAMRGEAIVVGPVGQTVQAVRADAGWDWCNAAAAWYRPLRPVPDPRPRRPGPDPRAPAGGAAAGDGPGPRPRGAA